MKPDRHLKGYALFKEAYTAAIEYANSDTQWKRIVPIYKESDNSFSVQNITDSASTFFVGIDKDGKQYKLAQKINEQGVPFVGYEEIKIDRVE